MMVSRGALISAVALALSLGGCAPYSSVRLQRPSYRSDTPAGRGIARASAHDRRAPLAALGEYVGAVRAASLALEKNPADTVARGDYNFALSRVFGTIREAGLDPWTQPLRLPAPDGGGDYVLTHRPEPRPPLDPALYELTPANHFEVRGTYVARRTLKPGLGAPLVAVGRTRAENPRADFALTRACYGVTALARFEGEGRRRCVLAFEDPLATEDVTVGGRPYPLAADFTAPLAVLLARENPRRLELVRLLRPGRYADTARIVRLQPYDPDKTVVLFVHGLADTAATWTPMLNRLRGDPQIRRRCQFWFYDYPSGYPYPYSATLLRGQLDAAEARFPLGGRKIVLVGHSMGSLISRLLITDSGERLWRPLFGKPPAQTRLTALSRGLLTASLVFRHRPEVGRVIFIAGPHRGSDLAANWPGRIGSMLIRSPVTLLKVGEEILHLGPVDATALRLKRVPNSVDTLAPNNRFVRALEAVPITPGIPYHSIVGDRGRGGNLDRTPPVSSDGVVPYWSSHLDGAQSELVVPSGHGAHQDPRAIAEVDRILRLQP